MAIDLVRAETVPSETNAVGIFVASDVATSDPRLPSVALERRGFEGKAGQTVVLDGVGQQEGDTPLVIAIGVGPVADLTLDGVRRAAAAFVRSASRFAHVSLVLDDLLASLDGRSVTQAATEGLLLGAYRYTAHKSIAFSDDRRLARVALTGSAVDEEGLRRGKIAAEATAMARDLVNAPPATATPSRLAEVAVEIGSRFGIAVTVWDETKIEEEGLGGLLGVSVGSDEPPRFVRMAYEPEGATRTLAIVGKGITFDSGGLSLKPADGMMTMKTDMSGAAAVIAAMSAIAELGPRTRVLAFVAATENLPGPKATKPGDVLKARNGKTMEVLNTDAEGRLVLADALSIAVEAEPDAIVDLATLTGACVVALGGEIAGVMGNNDELRTRVEEAAERAGEPVWSLPLPNRYRKHIDSDIADIKNIGAGKGAAGTLTAGLFLKEFVGDVPWVHLDIAGPARADGDDGYLTKGGTGFGVRTVIELAEHFSG